MSADRDGFESLAELAESGLLAASLFHEIRQPLFVLKGMVDLAVARREPLGEADLVVLRAELSHVEALLEHYAAVQPQVGDALELVLEVPVRAAIHAMGPRARQMGVVVHATVHTQARVLARPVAVRQVVANLLGNAIDAAVAGDRSVEIAVRERGDRVEIEVLDGGPGVSASVLARLGQPFVTTKAPGAGTGLGLFVTRRLVDEWGGTLTVEPRAGQSGTRAAVDLRRR